MKITIKEHNYIASFLLILVAVTMPLKNNINSMCLIITLGYFLAFILKKKRKIEFNRIVLLFITPFIYLLFQFFNSETDIYYKNLIRFIPILAFPIIFYNLKGILELKKEMILKTFSIGMTLFSLFLIGVAVQRQYNFSPDFSKINWYFFAYYDFSEALNIHPTYYGLYVSLSFHFFVSRILSVNLDVKTKPTYVLCGIILFVTVFFLGSRAILFCTIAALVFQIAVLYKKRSRKLVFTAAAISIGVFLIMMISFPIVRERMIDMTFKLKKEFSYAKYGKNLEYTGSLDARLDLWKCALHVSKRNIIFGNGFGYSQKRLNDCYFNNGMYKFRELDYQTHNQYMSFLVRGGIINLLLYLAILFIPLYLSYRTKDSLYGILICFIIVVSITENIMNRHWGIVFYGFMNSFLYFIKDSHLKGKLELTKEI